MCYVKKYNKGERKELGKNKSPALNYVHLLSKFKAVRPTCQHLLIKSHLGKGRGKEKNPLFFLLHAASA